MHQVGNLWGTILFEMYWELVNKNGFTADWMDSTKKQGNIIALKIIIGGLKFQPCQPTFLQARDAILLADGEYYNGENTCTLWKAFARRGLGSDAKTKEDGFKIPTMCQGTSDTGKGTTIIINNPGVTEKDPSSTALSSLSFWTILIAGIALGLTIWN